MSRGGEILTTQEMRINRIGEERKKIIREQKRERKKMVAIFTRTTQRGEGGGTENTEEQKSMIKMDLKEKRRE